MSDWPDPMNTHMETMQREVGRGARPTKPEPAKPTANSTGVALRNAFDREHADLSAEARQELYESHD